jgi:hypothetical protein
VKTPSPRARSRSPPTASTPTLPTSRKARPKTSCSTGSTQQPVRSVPSPWRP